MIEDAFYRDLGVLVNGDRVIRYVGLALKNYAPHIAKEGHAVDCNDVVERGLFTKK